MSRLTQSTNLVFGSIVLIGIVAAILLGPNPTDGGLMAAGVAVLTFGVLIAGLFN